MRVQRLVRDRLSSLSRQALVVPTTAFVLTFGLSACDLTATEGKVTGQGATLAGADMLAVETAAVRKVAATDRAGMQALAPQTAQAPPASTGGGVSDVAVTPLEKPASNGNALLEVRFLAEAKPADDVIKLTIDSNQTALVRSAGDPLLFTGNVFFDFERFAVEQEERKRLIESSGERTSAVFDGREFIGNEELGFVEPTTVRAAATAFSRLVLPRRVVAMPFTVVDPRRELFITDLSVVQDPTRTFDVCNNVGNPNGAWTFKTLMTNMANQPLTGIDPAIFVENWVRTWQVNNTVNTFNIPARPNIGPQVLNNWPRLPDGRLNLDRAPFRLLAIVNRVDLRGNPVYGGGSAGEGRLVFGVVNRSNNGGCSLTQFTTIFEYGVPISGCTNVKNYAQQWVNLGNITLGSAAFNPALQAITDQFTLANKAPNKPNGSALNQLRTNENSLNPLWELREFILPRGNGFLTITTAKDTPHRATYQNTATLANYINTCPPPTTPVPLTWPGATPFLTGSAFNPALNDASAWNAPGAINQCRHDFSLRTCDGCHGPEARANGNPFVAFPPPAETNFVHVTPRVPGQQSNLSKFLLGNGTLAAPGTFPKDDPINNAPRRDFGDLVRRQQDLANLMNTSCVTSGLVHAIRFSPLDFVH